jgi:type IV pilus assembly protein PilA
MRTRLNDEEGFTLIELMVVVLIIAVLVAIAVPSFLGFRNRAQDRAAQANLRNALLAEKANWTDDAAFTVTEADLKSYEPSIEIETTAIGSLTSDSDVAVYLSVASSDDQVCLVKEADSGNTFAIFEDASASGGTFYNGWSDAGTPACPTASGAPSAAGWVTSGFPADLQGAVTP